MIFDSDTHISPYKYLDIALTGAELDDALASAGVDRALVWLTPYAVDDVSDSNRYVYDQTRLHPRFVPFGWANVMEGEEKAIADAKECLDEFGFVGVKLNGAQNGYPIDSLSALRVCEQIAKRKGLIAFHIGFDEPNLTSPFRAAVVAREFPETPIVMVHMGGASKTLENASRAVIDVAKLCPNMMLVGSAIEVECVKTAIDELGPERVMFGSDAPFRGIGQCLDDYRRMLEPLDERVRGRVLYENAAKLYLNL